MLRRKSRNLYSVRILLADISSSMVQRKDEFLSRQRRFAIPQSSGWSLTTTFKLSIPLVDIGSSMAITVPFTYKFDTGV